VNLLTLEAEITNRTASLLVLGENEYIEGASPADVRDLVVQRARTVSAGLGRDLRLTMAFAGADARSVIVSPDGAIADDTTRIETAIIEDLPATPTPVNEAPVTPQTAGPAGIPPMPEAHPIRLSPVADLPVSEQDAVSERRAARQSFLVEQTTDAPAGEGLRGALNRTLGMHLAPSTRESQVRGWIRTAGKQFIGTRVIDIANGRGGVGKTTTTVCLAAAFGRIQSSGVLAWDNNDTRGSLGWRTENGAHQATIQDLLPEASHLLAVDSRRVDMEPFVHRQFEDKYDVLQSNPKLLSAAQRIDNEEFDLVHRVVAKYYGLILIDSGNDESAARWLRMIDHGNQLVVPTSTKRESAESAALLLDELRDRDAHSRMLADNAVVIVTHAERNSGAATAKDIVAGFTGTVRKVVEIPYDPALYEGQIRWNALQKATQEAWLEAAAAIAEQF
jgi:MinD-like ATPase involved in chromosome partitioning or flagellar assembly